MDRRAFLSATVSGLALGLGGCSPGATGRGAAPRTSRMPGLTSAPYMDVEEATIADLASQMSSGKISARELVDRYTARIEALDRAGPTLRSVLELNPDARAVADQLDAERRAKGPRGPLHGIPVLVKDNLDTADRMQTTAGSLALLGVPAKRDAHVVARLRAAGAVLLGKTNLSEWANLRDSRSLSGWSARGGLTKNPYGLDRNTSGSSSGSAAAIAANLAAVAIGTETDGSIVSPASVCGLVGLKPTVGLVSRAGIIPLAHSQDTAGPMTRTVTDTAILLGAIAGADPADSATAQARVQPDYTRFLDRQGARGARIGVMRKPRWVSPDAGAVFDAAMESFRRLGATVMPVETPLDDRLKEIDEVEIEVLLHELKADMAAYLATRSGQPLRTLEDIVKFNAAHARQEMPWFGQDLFEKAVQKGPLDSKPYLDAVAACKRLSRDEGIDRALSSQRLDALVVLTGGPAWVNDFVNGDHIIGGSTTLPAVAGYPSITVPCGAVHGLPLGILLFGAAWSEPVLLRIAFAYEQATHHRKKPTFARGIE